MNERIRELSKQAGITTNLDTDYFEKDYNKWVDYYSEKFAELIASDIVGAIRGLQLSAQEDGMLNVASTCDTIAGLIEIDYGVKNEKD